MDKARGKAHKYTSYVTSEGLAAIERTVDESMVSEGGEANGAAVMAGQAQAFHDRFVAASVPVLQTSESTVALSQKPESGHQSQPMVAASGRQGSWASVLELAGLCFFLPVACGAGLAVGFGMIRLVDRAITRARI